MLEVQREKLTKTISGRNRFAREHGLPLSNFGALLKGERDNCRGWTRVDGKPNRVFLKACYKYV